MTASGFGPPPGGLDALRLAVGSALVAGALSLVEPFLVSLVVALAALAVASWAMTNLPEGIVRRASLTGPTGVRLAALFLGVMGFLLLPSPLAPLRAGVLAVALVPLTLRTRGAEVRTSAGETSP